MGVFESSSNNFASMSTNDEYSSNKSKEIKQEIFTYLKKNDGFILSANLAKRDDINKYYKITHKILGKGACGVVCIGEKDGTEYAIKRIKKDKIKLLKLFRLEAEISLQLRHENIITYYEVYEDSHYISYVMDLAEGGDLFSFISDCPLHHLPSDIVIELLIQILTVVDYLHSVKGIVHRDIKPQNFLIKINKKNKPLIKLIDFGFATYIPKNNEKLKELLGTTEYAAPEILQGAGYMEKVDEWSIGVMLFNMLTGLEPFLGETDSQIKDSVLYNNIQFNRIEDVDLRELCQKLMNRYVAKRITCKEALVEVKKIKVERDNYYKGFKRLNKKTPSEFLKKVKKEDLEYNHYLKGLIGKLN